MFLLYAAYGISIVISVAVLGFFFFHLTSRGSETDDLTSAIDDATDDSIFVLGRDYRYIFINRNHLSRLGIKHQDYRGRSYADFHTAQTTREFTGIVDRVFISGEQIHHEHQSERDGEYYLLTLSPVKEAGETVSAVAVCSRRITGMKRLEEKVNLLAQRELSWST